MAVRRADAPPRLHAVEVSALSFAYRERTALNELSLQVPQGCIFGLLGPNGSGKSTLLMLIAGLRRPGEGEVRVLGAGPSPALRARIGVLFQEASLDPLMTVRETLWLQGRLYGMTAEQVRERAGLVLETLWLADRATSPAGSLSGGLKRRLELARALLPAPELLLLDEPTTGLDPESEQALWAHLMEVNRAGTTVLLATNKVSEAERYCQRVALVHEGRVVAEGTPPRLKAGLKHDSVWVEGSFADDALDRIAGWPDVAHLSWRPPVLHATVGSASDFVPRLFQAADRITSVRIREASLEDAYFDIVGAAIAEGSE